MKRQWKLWALALVSGLLLSACTNRTILHGSRGHHPVQIARERFNVWFVRPDENGSHLVSVSRRYSQGDHLEQAVEDLLAGPSSHEVGTGLGSEIPRGTILLGISRRGSSVELNLSKRFAAGGASSFETRLEQLRRTVAGPANSTDVFLSVEGKRLNISEGEGVEVHQPINR